MVILMYRGKTLEAKMPQEFRHRKRKGRIVSEHDNMCKIRKENFIIFTKLIIL